MYGELLVYAEHIVLSALLKWFHLVLIGHTKVAM